MSITARPIAMTIGVFDGLHRGHRRVIDATVAEAREREGSAWVVTFDPHPDTVVRGIAARPWITPPEEREELLHAMGVDRVHVERFDDAVRDLTPEGFLDHVLGQGAPLRALVIGHDFRMGKGRVGDRDYLEQLGGRRGFTVREVPFLTEEGEKLSSTRLRHFIERGLVEDASAMLGRPYALRGRIGVGLGRGTQLGFPTANLELLPEKLLPAPGIYVSENHVLGRAVRGLTYVGSAATFGPGPVRVEVHLTDDPPRDPMRGEWLATELYTRLREDRVFGSPEELVRAMDQDLAKAAEYWNSTDRRASGAESKTK